MHRVTRWVLVGTVAALVALPAGAEPRTTTETLAPAAAITDEERAFEADAERYQRLAELTQKLVRERERQAFEDAVAHYQRFAELTRKLADAAARAAERALDAEVELYVKKLSLTRELTAERAAQRAPNPTGALQERPAPGAYAAPAW